ncbi:hypothetical protein CS062_21295 [Roseateles chitinivorans]|uniref:TonB C-terminal domain-containing protein n=1 Tax=Roseateles chitinivorans TaxID=2917965 RepID=A0A2G9C458_9BURK|nr:energy transducer TonB [Roseateles chitinivorans]PIM51168.1 hypothetical protein CS062_21295 [Roseateles chitinivorans]
MTALAPRLHGFAPRWSGWAVTGAVHAAMVLALASAFAPQRSAPAPAPASMVISARLLASTATPTATPVPPPATATAMAPIALPRSALDAPPVPDLPPPTVEIAPTSLPVPPAASRLEAPVASGTPIGTGAGAATATAGTGTSAGAGAGASAAATVDASATLARQTVAAATAVAPAVAATQTPAPVPTDLPAALPADHRLCSERQTARHYPALLRDRGIQGLVRLRVKVDPDGRAAEVVIAGGSGWRLLDEAARRVAESCPYTPARRGDQRLASWIEYPVRFALQAAPLQ